MKLIPYPVLFPVIFGKKSGVSFSKLLDDVLQMGLKKYRISHNKIHSWNTNLLSMYEKGQGKLK